MLWDILFLQLLLFWNDYLISSLIVIQAWVFFLTMWGKVLSSVPHKLSEFYKTLPSRSKQALLTLVSIDEYRAQGKKKALDLMSGTAHVFCWGMKVYVCCDKTFISSYFKGKTTNSFPKHKNFWPVNLKSNPNHLKNIRCKKATRNAPT